MFNRNKKKFVRVWTVSNETLDGVYLGSSGGFLILASAKWIVAQDREQAMQGNVHIPLRNVHFMCERSMG